MRFNSFLYQQKHDSGNVNVCTWLGKKAANALKNAIISKHHKARNHQKLKSNKQWKPGVISTWRVHSSYSRHLTKGIFIHIWENAWIHILWWRLVEKIDIHFHGSLNLAQIHWSSSGASLASSPSDGVWFHFILFFYLSIFIHDMWQNAQNAVSRFTKQLFFDWQVTKTLTLAFWKWGLDLTE